MTNIREEKVQRVANYIPELHVDGDQEGDLLIVGWGGTYGSLFTALSKCSVSGKKIGFAHFNYIKPLPRNTTEVFGRFKQIVVCELNNGQFVKYLRGELPQYQYQAYNKVQGLPFTVSELTDHFQKLLEN
jgi:2-oxoglutarate ferredoxin oxidoreductase subunit alpha